MSSAIADRKSASHGEAGYPRAAFDFYPTEPWVTRALLSLIPLAPAGLKNCETLVWEPACGDGRMAKVLIEHGYRVESSDLADHGYGRVGADFLTERPWFEEPINAIVTNPPFDLAPRFIARALELTEPQRGIVAMIQRHEFDAPFKNRPLFVWPYASKLILHKRPRWSDDDKASPRFPYAWYVWDWRHQGPPVTRWLPDPDKPATGKLL